jgi:hypothetical protein
VLKVLLVGQALQEHKDLKVPPIQLKEPEEHKDHKEIKVRILQALQVHQELKVIRELKVFKVLKVDLDRQGLKDHQETKGQQEIQVVKVLKETQVLKEHHRIEDLKIILPNLKTYYQLLKKLKELGLHGILNILKLRIINQLQQKTHLKVAQLE